MSDFHFSFLPVNWANKQTISVYLLVVDFFLGIKKKKMWSRSRFQLLDRFFSLLLINLSAFRLINSTWSSCFRSANQKVKFYKNKKKFTFLLNTNSLQLIELLFQFILSQVILHNILARVLYVNFLLHKKLEGASSMSHTHTNKYQGQLLTEVTFTFSHYFTFQSEFIHTKKVREILKKELPSYL